MAAFEAAVKIGAHALETDVHLSKDGVVVLSHVSHLILSPASILVVELNRKLTLLLGPLAKEMLRR